MTASEAILAAKLRLDPIAQDESLQQAKFLVAAILGVEPAAVTVHTQMVLTREQIELLGELLERRERGEPLQYLLGEWSFMGLPFLVDERVLIPRQDTELLCETALERIKSRGYRTVLDLCTGSGCVGIAVRVLSGADVTASDVSAEALEVARENAKLNEADVSFVESDLFGTIPGAFDLIVCNPPYLSRQDLEGLQTEITYEPRLALDGGKDGLDFYRRIAPEYRAHLNEGGALLMEIGAAQAEAASALFSASTRVLNDLSGNPRVLIVEGEPPRDV